MAAEGDHYGAERDDDAERGEENAELDHKPGDRRQRPAVEHVLKDRDAGIDAQGATEVEKAKTEKDADQGEANGAAEGSDVDRLRGGGIHALRRIVKMLGGKLRN